MTIHQQRTHPTYVEGCYGCKISHVALPSPGFTKSGGRDFGRDLDRKWDHELDYYADLRKQGIQPAGTTEEKCLHAEQMSQAEGAAWQADDPFKNNIKLHEKVAELNG